MIHPGPVNLTRWDIHVSHGLFFIATVSSLKMRNSLARLRKLVLLLSDHHQKLLMVLAIKLKLELLVGIYYHVTIHGGQD